MDLLQVLYEDNHLIAVFKPARTLTQGDATGDPSLMDEVKAWLKEKYKKPGNVFLGLVHRLDRPVSGLIVFAKTSKGASRLSEQFRSRSVRKIYLAVVEGVPREREQSLVHTLDGKEARLSYRTLEHRGTRALLEIELKTGRKHQIRRQLSETGHPIVGDKLHGANCSAGGEIALMAKLLEFDHPVTDVRMRLEVPESLWTLRKYIS